MSNLKDYFERNAYKPKYFIGDRVYGKFNGIPFIGTVGNDRVVGLDGPEVTIHLDLPMRIDKYNHNVIVVKHKDIKKLVVWD
jgi:hypothetical protein